MSAYKGLEKCHGCGTAGCDRPRYGGKNSLCHVCQDFLTKGKRVKEEAGTGPWATIFSGRRLEPSGRLILKTVTHAIRNPRKEDPLFFCASPSQYVSEGFDRKGYPGSSQHVHDLLAALAATLDLGEKNTITAHVGHRVSGGVEATVTMETANAWIRLVDGIGLYSKRIQREAHRDGTSLLHQLNAGTLTVADFNRRAKTQEE